MKKKQERILVYAGGNYGRTLGTLKDFDLCYVFEASPSGVKKLKKRFKNDKRIVVIHAALSETDGEIPFYLYSSSGSNSMSPNLQHHHFKVVEKIVVKSVNLSNFLKDKGISEIDYYFSDIQGMDFTVLNTISDFVKEGRIKKITCEVEKDGKKRLYKELNNKFSKFERLLGDKYKIESNEAANPNSITTDVTWVLKSE